MCSSHFLSERSTKCLICEAFIEAKGFEGPRFYEQFSIFLNFALMLLFCKINIFPFPKIYINFEVKLCHL